MGIKGLWTHVEPAARAVSLLNICLEHLKLTNALFSLGIDISLWFHNCPSGLETIFFRCCRLRALPIRVVFVFDGKARPTMKRGHKVLHRNYATLPAVRRLLDAFGFDFLDAPGEAEAELAMMNQEGIINAVMTEDIDAFLFGANTVFRRQPGVEELSQVIEYNINHHGEQRPRMDLSRGNLLLIAVLSGGDYGAGLRGCGLSTALRLTHTGLGNQLYEAAVSQTSDDFEAFLGSWRSRLRQELQFNHSGCLNKRAPSAAREITEDFPEKNKIYSYMRPAVSAYLEQPKLWTKKFDIKKLAGFMSTNLDWDDELILKRLTKQTLTGAVIDYLLTGKSDFAQNVASMTVLRERCMKSSSDLEYLVRIPIGTIYAALPAAFESVKKQLPEYKDIWLPEVLLSQTVPCIIANRVNSANVVSGTSASTQQTHSYLQLPSSFSKPKNSPEISNSPLSSDSESLYLPEPHELLIR